MVEYNTKNTLAKLEVNNSMVSEKNRIIYKFVLWWRARWIYNQYKNSNFVRDHPMITYVQFKIRFHVSENLFKTFPYGSHIKSMLKHCQPSWISD